MGRSTAFENDDQEAYAVTGALMVLEVLAELRAIRESLSGKK